MTAVQEINEAEQLRLEKGLAEALGWTDIEIGGVFDDVLFGINPESGLRGKIEEWTRDWYGCAEIMVKHGAFPQPDFALGKVVGVTVFAGTPYQASVAYESCENEDLAVRCAIVEGLTNKLIHDKNAEPIAAAA